MEKAIVDPEDAARDDALVDNTAQGIFNYLDDVENKREVYQRRWIWELLQNALDSTEEGKTVEVTITSNGSELTFEHNGRSFKQNEVAHLIYHGSTKLESSIGKFGTGFLVTHLLTRKVTVRGKRMDGKSFDFVLDRSGKSAQEIKEQADLNWRNYKSSLKSPRDAFPFSAQYTYLYEDRVAPTVNEGLLALTEIAPYVIAFSRKFGKITINDGSTKRTFQLSSGPETPPTKPRLVSEQVGGEDPTTHEIQVVADSDIEVALKLTRQASGLCRIGDITRVPRIFIAFPLYATEQLPFPVVVNSTMFEPTEKRDGIFLGKEDTDKIRKNKTLLKQASLAFVKLLSDSDISDWENLYSILSLEPPATSEWLTDDQWYVDMLKKLVESLLGLPLLKTHEGKIIAIGKALFPSTEDSPEEHLQKLWYLASLVTSYAEYLPSRTTSSNWAAVLSAWENLGLELSERMVTLVGIGKLIAESGSITGLQSRLKPGTRVLAFLNYYCQMLKLAGKLSLLDELEILPNQNGLFVQKKTLLRESDINESLKDIIKKAGKDVRASLAHKDLSEMVLDLLPQKQQSEVLRDAVSLVKENKSPSPTQLEANKELFKWLVDNKYLGQLDGYPLQTTKSDSFVALNEEEETPLSPSKFWPESAQQFQGLFPEESIISGSYFDAVPERVQWEEMAKKGLVRLSPVFEERATLTEDEINLLLEQNTTLDEKADHGSTMQVVVSNIAFLETDSSGIIDSIRSSKEGTRKFLSFLIDHVLVADKLWMTPLEVECNCGHSHQIYPSIWLARLKDRAWVPLRKGKSDKPTVQALAGVVSDDSALVSKFRSELASRFVHSLGLTVSELLLRAITNDEPTRLQLDSTVGSLYDTFKDDPNQLAKVAKLAETNVKTFVKELEERLQDQKQREINQVVGKDVEELLKSIFENDERFKAKGLTITPTGVGSDFAIEVGVGGRKIKIEVKSTVQDHVKMTLVQAREASLSPSDHVLAVVKHKDESPTEEEVRSSVRFVVDIGVRIVTKVKEAEKLQTDQTKAAGSTDIAVEIQEDPMGIRVYEKVWTVGSDFDAFLTFVERWVDSTSHS